MTHHPYTVAINGFGRIGRTVLNFLLKDPRVTVSVINDITDVKTLAHLLKYDSVHGVNPATIGVVSEGGADWLVIDGRKIRVTAIPKLEEMDNAGIDVFLECSGRYKKRADGQKPIDKGAKKVIFSAPMGEADLTVVLGVNETAYDPARHHILSNASCTTNCLAPVAKVIADRWGIVRGFMTTVHAYTNDQRILDMPHKDLRRARAAAMSMIPTTTGAAKAVGLVIPELKGKLDGIAIRVPTPNVSVVDLVFQTARPASVDAIRAALKEASASERLAPIIRYCDEPLVSVDFNGDDHSAIVDAENILSLSKDPAVEQDMFKLLAWYDNETGYSRRLAELAGLVAG